MTLHNYDDIESSYLWYKSEGHAVPRLEILGPHPLWQLDVDQAGETYTNYTNLVLYGSDWSDESATASRTQATFTDADMIKLRDYLNEHFPQTALEVSDPNADLVTTDDDLSWLDDLAEDFDDDNDLVDTENPEDDSDLEDDDELELFEVEYDWMNDEHVIYELTYTEIASFKDESEALDYALYRNETYED